MAAEDDTSPGTTRPSPPPSDEGDEIRGMLTRIHRDAGERGLEALVFQAAFASERASRLYEAIREDIQGMRNAVERIADDRLRDRQDLDEISRTMQLLETRCPRLRVNGDDCEAE